jgi:hypothetical protein
MILGIDDMATKATKQTEASTGSLLSEADKEFFKKEMQTLGYLMSSGSDISLRDYFAGMAMAACDNNPSRAFDVAEKMLLEKESRSRR